MCRRVTCKTCKKPTWAGCGAHVDQVLGDVPKSERCACHETKRGSASAQAAESGGWFSRVRGRN